MKNFRFFLPVLTACILSVLLSSCGVVFLLTYDADGVNSDVMADYYFPEEDTKANEDAQSDEVSTPLLWQVTGEGFDGEFYLLGSIHMGLRDTNVYPDELCDAFDSCEFLAVESDVIALESDIDAQIGLMQYFLYTDGSTISDHIDEDTYKRGRAILDHYGMYNQMMDSYIPIMWQQTIDQVLTEDTDFNFNYGVDRYFLSEAKERDMEILEVENYLDTYKALCSISGETQEFLLSQVVQPMYVRTYGESIEYLYDIWKKGDPDEIEAYMMTEYEGISDEELKCYEEYNEVLMENRNKIMLECAVEYLEDDMSVFYVVGLAHMLDSDGLVEGLASQGYDVRLVEYSID